MRVLICYVAYREAIQEIKASLAFVGTEKFAIAFGRGLITKYASLLCSALLSLHVSFPNSRDFMNLAG